MKYGYTHRIHAYYTQGGKNDYHIPIDKSKKSSVLTTFLGNNVKTEGNFVIFESMNCWGDSLVNKFHVANVVKVEEIMEAKEQ